MIGDRIKELRKKIGLTQQQLADELGVSSMTISNYEQNQRKPDSDFIYAAAKYFDVTSDYLVGLTNATKKKNVDISRITGLSDFSIDILEQSEKETGGTAADIANRIIDSGAFLQLKDAVWDMTQRQELRQKPLKFGDIKELKIKDLQAMKDNDRYAILQRIFPDYNLLRFLTTEREIKDNIDIIAQMLRDKYIPEAYFLGTYE